MTGLPALVIVIHNDEVPLDESWRRLFGSAHGSLVTLAGLTPEELVRLAVARGHFGLSPAAAARLHEHTGGNPLYASALLAQLPARDLAAGALPARGPSWRRSRRTSPGAVSRPWPCCPRPRSSAGPSTSRWLARWPTW